MGTLGLTICQWNCGWLWGYVRIWFTLRTSSPWYMSSNYITDIQVSHLQMNTLSCWSCGRVPQEIDKHHILSFWHGHGMDTLLNYICTYEAMWIVLSLYSLSWTDRRSKRHSQIDATVIRILALSIQLPLGDSIVFVVNHKAYYNGIKLHRKKSQSWTLIYSNNIQYI